MGRCQPKLGLPSGLCGCSLCTANPQKLPALALRTLELSLIGNSEEAPKDCTAQCWKVDPWTTSSAAARAPQPGIEPR